MGWRRQATPDSSIHVSVCETPALPLTSRGWPVYYAQFEGLKARPRAPGGTFSGGEHEGSTGLMRDAQEKIAALFAEHQGTVKAFLARERKSLEAAVELLVKAFRGGRRAFFFGNGGSAADAQHLAAEFVNRFQRERPALPALALTTDTSVITSVANDRAFEEVFSRQLEALAAPEDVAVALSTSGTSPNVVRGVEAARKLGLRTIVFTGAGGADLARRADVALMVPCGATSRIQEVHMLAGHVLCHLVEEALFADAGPAGD